MEPHRSNHETEGCGGHPRCDQTGAIAQGPINFEEELEHASVLLEEVRDEAVAVVERAQVVEARLRDLDGWVRDLRKRVKASQK